MLIKQLIENRDADEYVRDAGLRALLTLVVNGERTREEVMDYYKSLFRGKLEREYSMVWNGLVTCSSYLCPEEVYADIKKAADRSRTVKLVCNMDILHTATD